MAKKQTSESIFFPCRYRTQTYPTGVWSADSTAQSSSAVRTRSRSGSSMPDYAERIRKHKSATTAFDATDFAFKKRPGRIASLRVSSFSSGVIWRQEFDGIPNSVGAAELPSTPPTLGGSAYTDAHNIAVQRLYDVLRTYESPSFTGEDIGEVGQTMRLIRRPMAGLQNLTKYFVENHTRVLKNARWNNTKQVAKALADLTLEYRFGIKPLISTLAEAKVALENRDIMFNYYTFNVSGRAESRSSVDELSSVSNLREWWTKTTVDRYFVRYRGQYESRHNVDRRSFNASIGLTWREAIPTIYNLIPYSFLADYVSNLGTFAQVLSVPWSGVAWCNKTIRAERVFTASGRDGHHQSGLYQITSYTPGGYEFRVKRVVRSNQESLPLPRFSFRQPSVRQLENTLALVAGRLPIIGNLTKKLNKQSNGALDRDFKLAVRDRNLKIPYPIHRFNRL